MAVISVSDALLAFLNKKRVYFSPFGNDKVAGRFRLGENLHFINEVKIEPYCCYINGSFLFSMGSFSFSRSVFHPATRVGRYCSIGARVSVLGVNHPINRFTTSNITYDKHTITNAQYFEDHSEVENFQVNNNEPANNKNVSIGHDVWIGEDVSISRGITVGDGAILAAKAMVTKDVPPYAIVGGNPARVIRYRFSETQIEQLVDLQWWNYDLKDVINDKADVSIEDFIDFVKFKRQNNELPVYCPDVVSAKHLLEFSK
ncbi:CatB-related O-acetyltransferase [Paraglaciecola sp. MB-3u-78]|jgi:acetyltransferase-like isoleucine patch superfamily enzyme|uniref:CatB-related O-acetyltransferase n=1 Tax=Paraglaciecola sp. MB-3u-78 TaxID=2058332 RepID=UPI000C325095|nr:CatB-related O-acetyltransferase [Paraglaciecola sp. MB-3u-78]PKH00965.1 capsular biosynthesis protein [Paraglaciecola sp. MB-3u-78]